MPQSNQYSTYQSAIAVLASGDEAQLAELEQFLEGFPKGEDDYFGSRWIINAIAFGSRKSVEWMLSRGVDITFRGEDGYTVLHLALEGQKSDKYEIFELLLQYGASVNARGINDWTPAHMAAAHDDIKALELLIRYGADLSIRTRIDDYATPLEEARVLKSTRAIEFLENLASQVSPEDE